jgi:uncharacterized protein (UPF0335 family)
MINRRLNTKLASVSEGITEAGTPDMKYYAFDWDDNIMKMPTKIILKTKDGEEVGMSTEDFAHYRSKIGSEEFKYEDNIIVGYGERPFRNFNVEGDKKFVIDAMTAEIGPAWSDFVEAINNGSIFAIITARGHTPSVLREACYNLILSGRDGISYTELLKNLEKYRDIAGYSGKQDRIEIMNEYLDLCKFYPVSYGEGSATSPEEGKIKAMKEFISYIKNLSQEIGKKAFLKNDVSNNFIPEPTVGFSDDDLRNVETMKKHFEQEPDNILQTYSTAGGIKRKY